MLTTTNLLPSLSRLYFLQIHHEILTIMNLSAHIPSSTPTMRASSRPFPCGPVQQHQQPRHHPTPVNQAKLDDLSPVFECPAQILQHMIEENPANCVKLQSVQARIVILENRTAELLREKEHRVLAAEAELMEVRREWNTNARNDSNVIADLTRDKNGLSKANEELRRCNENLSNVNTSMSQLQRDQRAVHAKQKKDWLLERQKFESNVRSLTEGKETELKVVEDKFQELEKERRKEEVRAEDLFLKVKLLEDNAAQGDKIVAENKKLRSLLQAFSLDLGEQERKLEEAKAQLDSVLGKWKAEEEERKKTIDALNHKITELLSLQESFQAEIRDLQDQLCRASEEILKLGKEKETLNEEVEEMKNRNRRLEVQIDAMAKENCRLVMEAASAVKESEKVKRYNQHLGAQQKKLLQEFEAFKKSENREVLQETLLRSQETILQYEQLVDSMSSLSAKRKTTTKSPQSLAKRQRLDSGKDSECTSSPPNNLPLGASPPPPPPSDPLPRLTTPPPPPLRKIKVFM